MRNAPKIQHYAFFYRKKNTTLANVKDAIDQQVTC